MGYSPWACQESDTTKGLSMHASSNLKKQQEKNFFFKFESVLLEKQERKKPDVGVQSNLWSPTLLVGMQNGAATLATRSFRVKQNLTIQPSRHTPGSFT